jgi:hypothetical protein
LTKITVDCGRPSAFDVASTDSLSVESMQY